MSKKFHWFSLSFICGNNTSTVYSSAFRGVPVSQGKRLKDYDLKKARETAGADDEAVLINCTYMGLWTKDEILEE